MKLLFIGFIMLISLNLYAKDIKIDKKEWDKIPKNRVIVIINDDGSTSLCIPISDNLCKTVGGSDVK